MWYGLGGSGMCIRGSLGLTRVGGGVLIVAWAVIWAVIVSLVSTNDYESNKSLHWFEAFYRTGSILFGGGQVVLPLLLEDVTDCPPVCFGAREAAAVPYTHLYGPEVLHG